MRDVSRTDDLAADLLRFIDASPTPFHAVERAVQDLDGAGYRRLDEGEPWSLEPGDRVYIVRDGSSLIALEIGSTPPSQAGFRLVGAHTDSPNLRVKPNPEVTRHGSHQLSLEVYGGVLLHTWLDRDLSLAGRVVLERQGAQEIRLIDFRRPLLRIPTVAIHLDRTVNTEGLVLNPQKHLVPLAGLDAEGPLDIRALIADALGDGVGPSDVLSWDLSAYDVVPSTRSGLRGELLHAPRLDNLASCHAGLAALIRATGEPSPVTRGIVLYDHEEVGSRSAKGAASAFLRAVLERVARSREDTSDAFARAVHRSFVVSADMAHAVHPNYTDRHDSEHMPLLGQGPVVKINANQSYATEAAGWGLFEQCCRKADVTPQRFVSRGDMPCGSTIGPITAAELGIRTVDVGNPMLSMHSCRELAAAADVPQMVGTLTVFLSE
jgi:aspartyl aminopeptidase